MEDAVADPAAVEAEAVGARVRLATAAADHAVVGAGRIGEASTEGLGEEAAIGDTDSALAVDVELGVRDSLAQSNLFPLVILDWDLVRVVAASPDHQVCITEVLSLVLWLRRRHEGDPLLVAVLHLPIEPLGIAAEAGVGVDEASGIGEDVLTELSVAVGLRLVDRAVEDANLIPVEDLDAAWAVVRWQVLVMIKVPVFVLEVAPALAQAVALRILLLLGLGAAAAFSAVRVALQRRIREASSRYGLA